MKVNPPRPLTTTEAGVLNLLLSADVPGAAALRTQAPTARVIGSCDCGCPTVDLSVSSDAPTAHEASDGPLPVDGDVDLEAAAVSNVGGAKYTGDSVIVFVRDGRLTSLELSYYDDPPTSWPPLEAIRLH